MHHTTKPDTTKLLRATEDALRGIAWADDNQVCEQHAFKLYGMRPGVHVFIETVTPTTPRIDESELLAMLDARAR
jgi:Holliday junction resolvase RusA-like endonuclease